MRIVAYIVAGMLSLVGVLMSSLFPNTPEYAAAPAEPVSAGILLFMWGLLLYLGTRHRYRGGVPSFIGAILLGLGLWNVVGTLTWKYGSQITANIITSILLVAGGMALLYHGHKNHMHGAESGGWT